MGALDTTAASYSQRRKSGQQQPPNRNSLDSSRGLSRRSLGMSSRTSIGSRASIDSLGSSTRHSIGVSASALSGSKNPITNDVKLNILVHDKLRHITKYKQFQRWKCKFLERLNTYLAQSGMKSADAASRELQVHLETCLKRASMVLERIERGDLSPTSQKRTVKASQALKEFGMSLEECRVELEELVPAKQIDEKRKRYTKFHVGASLIRDGFPQYVAMKELEECVHAISDRTYDIESDYDNLNKQERELFLQYKTQVARFCDVMSDLDLYDIMLTCVEFLHPPENEDDDDVEELTIFVKRYQRYQQGGIKKSSSDGTDETDSDATDSDFEPSFRSDDDSLSLQSARPVIVKVDAEDCETVATIAAMVAEELGFHLKPLEAVDITNQLTIRHSKDIVVRAPNSTTLKQLQMEHGDVLTLEQAMIPIKVRQVMASGIRMDMNVMIDPLAPLRELKFAVEHQQHQKGDGISTIRAEDQRLFLAGNELDNDEKSCSSYGIIAGSILDLETKAVPAIDTDALEGIKDRIVIVDTKYGTMFSVEREVVIKEGVLTPKIINQDDVFREATTKDIDKDRMLKCMMSSIELRVKPQVVVEKLKIEDYELGDDMADDVKSIWGVELKKTGQQRRMTEIFFVDLKTQAIGFLNRKALIDTKFITVVKATNFTRDNKEEEFTLEQAEKDQQLYDCYVFEIRKIFGIAAAFE